MEARFSFCLLKLSRSFTSLQNKAILSVHQLPHQYSNMLLLHFMFLLRNKWLQLDCPVATFPLTSLVFSAYPETVAGMGNINCPSLCFGYTASHETVIPDYAEECAYAQR
jgi:hypothetical protein